jgi:pyridoxamine 5'-phosphate oxidase family protein
MSRFLLLPLLLLVVVVLVLAIAGRRAAVGAGAPPRAALPDASARWRARHYAHEGSTVVAVALTNPAGQVLEEHVVARFADTDPEWEPRFLAARDEAERRAFHLNADLPPAA